MQNKYYIKGCKSSSFVNHIMIVNLVSKVLILHILPRPSYKNVFLITRLNLKIISLNLRYPLSLQLSQPSTRSMKDKRLLVKVIKANGLGDKDFGCSDQYCIVEMDEPMQKHTTSVVKNTVNPFWDEHFLLWVSKEHLHSKKKWIWKFVIWRMFSFIWRCGVD